MKLFLRYKVCNEQFSIEVKRSAGDLHFDLFIYWFAKITLLYYLLIKQMLI